MARNHCQDHILTIKEALLRLSSLGGDGQVVIFDWKENLKHRPRDKVNDGDSPLEYHLTIPPDRIIKMQQSVNNIYELNSLRKNVM